ncbi:MAG: hypothetical protein CBE21_05640 [Proteobacteria bacterium TMED261]|nr:MAG: hypothetical protein CBE21_05640 [Proteobacteria bacterium TMED261]
MLAIISPAKTLDFSETERSQITVTEPIFIKESNKLNKTLRSLEPCDLASLMKISDKLADLNHRRNLEWQGNTNKHLSSKAALMAFKGDVYQGLDATSLEPKELKWAQRHLRILSGLYGVLRPFDEICAYRLEMGTSLSNTKGKDLYEFWGSKVTDALNEALTKGKHRALVNLASNEYFKVVTSSNIKAEILNINFKEKKDGKYKFISIYGKKARGLMARFMIKNRITQHDDLKAFDYEDYGFNAGLSEDNNWTFTRG